MPLVSETSDTQEVIGEATDPDEVIRIRWGRNLRKMLARREMTTDAFHVELLNRNVKVTKQAVRYWLAGKYAPKPSHQAVIAGLFSVETHMLFPIEPVQKAAA